MSIKHIKSTHRSGRGLKQINLQAAYYYCKKYKQLPLAYANYISWKRVLVHARELEPGSIKSKDREVSQIQLYVPCRPSHTAMLDKENTLLY